MTYKEQRIQQIRFYVVWSAVIILLLLIACKPNIEVLPIGDEAYPLKMLENGNYEVTPGYVLKHTALMAEVKILKAKLEECRKDK